MLLQRWLKVVQAAVAQTLIKRPKTTNTKG
jgi:hypothetical protein